MGITESYHGHNKNRGMSRRGPYIYSPGGYRADADVPSVQSKSAESLYPLGGLLNDGHSNETKSTTAMYLCSDVDDGDPFYPSKVTKVVIQVANPGYGC